MQSINVVEKGIAYLGTILSMYMENCAYFMIYLVALLYILIKGDEKEKEIFLPSAIFLFATVYNPAVPLLLDRFFDVNSEYYRLFWIAPVVVAISYLAAKIIDGHKNTGEKVTSVILILVIGLLAGNFVYSDGYKLAADIYKMPPQLIAIDEMIHADTDVEYPKAFFEYEYNMQIRQYDAKMQLTIDREDYLMAVGQDIPEELVWDDEHPQYRILAALVRGREIDVGSFLAALEGTKTEYIAVSKGNPAVDLLEEANLSVVGSTEEYVVYRYDVQEPYEFELIDYSDVEHRFSYRRIK